MTLRKNYADTPLGQVRTIECGEGSPVLFLHQTSPSWREYAEVLPIAGRSVRAIAMDTVGFSQSCNMDGLWPTELFADRVQALLDALALPTVSLVGHHTGALVALEVADRVEEGHVRVNEHRTGTGCPSSGRGRWCSAVRRTAAPCRTCRRSRPGSAAAVSSSRAPGWRCPNSAPTPSPVKCSRS